MANRKFNPATKYADMTPRERLISAAVGFANRHRCDSHLAIEAVLDGCSQLDPNTFGGQMYAYYRGISQAALDRLVAAVDNNRARGV